MLVCAIAPTGHFLDGQAVSSTVANGLETSTNTIFSNQTRAVFVAARPVGGLSLAVSLLLYASLPVNAQMTVGVSIGLPGVDIGIDMPSYPNLVPVPGYPVYYAPRASSNYFFYDGMYWVFQNDNWYESGWYNGPWQFVGPEYVPLFVLRVPVRYYRQPPVYFSDWRRDAPPQWGDHWGREWEQRRAGWNRWDHRAVVPAAPLPAYQRQYTGNRYPRAAEQQNAIRSEHQRGVPAPLSLKPPLQPPAPVAPRSRIESQVRGANGQRVTEQPPPHLQSQPHAQPHAQPPVQVGRPAVEPQRNGPDVKPGHQEKGHSNERGEERSPRRD